MGRLKIKTCDELRRDPDKILDMLRDCPVFVARKRHVEAVLPDWRN